MIAISLPPDLEMRFRDRLEKENRQISPTVRGLIAAWLDKHDDVEGEQ